MSLTRPLTRPLPQSLTRALTAPGAGGGFNPASLFAAGEKGIALDLTDMSKLFQDIARTTPVTATGQPIGSATDLSGNGVNANAAANDTTRPTFNGYATFDGSNDSLQTALVNFTATDKITVVLGVHKNSDAAAGIAVELSPASATNPGAFFIAAPGAAAANYRAELSAASSTTAYNATTFAAPISNTVSVVFNIAGANRAEEIPTFRINGTTPTLSGGGSASAGTGNFGNYELYIGRRGGLSLPLNGRIYRMIVIGRVLNAQEISDAEAWCGSPFS